MKGHKHAAILAQAAEDAKTDPKFYEKWQVRRSDRWFWQPCHEAHIPGSLSHYEYRRKPAKPRECWARWNPADAAAGLDPWRSAWSIESKPDGTFYTPIHMIEVTPEVRAALTAAGIEVS